MFRDYPLANHNRAHIAAEAAQCAREQGKFWEYHDMLFANQKNLENQHLKEYAAQLVYLTVALLQHHSLSLATSIGMISSASREFVGSTQAVSTQHFQKALSM